MDQGVYPSLFRFCFISPMDIVKRDLPSLVPPLRALLK